MKPGMSFLLSLSILAVVSTALPQQPMNPIMGIFTDPLAECGYTAPQGTSQCMEAFYPKWLATAGIRSVPIPWNATKTERDRLLQSVNGILFPGGGLGGQQLEEYFAVVQEIVDQAVEWNRAGDPFVVWGTCMGFQVVCAAVARNLSVIQGGYHGLYPAMLPITFSAAQPSSRMFGTLTTPAHILSVLSSQNSTLNWHHAGVSPNAFVAVQSLGAGLKILSTNVDVNGKSFVSSVEGTDGTAIFATQFHPERIQFEYTNDLIGHTKGDIEVSEYLALFIAEQLKKNNHTFSSPSDAEAHSIHNYPIVNYGLGYELYWLP